MAATTPGSLAGISLTFRRHLDPSTTRISQVSGHQATVGSDPVGAVTALFQQGARHVVLPEPVDLGPAADGERSARALVLLRELTSWAIEVEWSLRLHADSLDLGRLVHLCPPANIVGTADAAGQLAMWRSGFFFGACVYRRGPGFVQVRDRRAGHLSRFTIDDPGYLAVIGALTDGSAVDCLAAEVIADFEAEGLVGQVGGHAWWLPCGIRRWPIPAMII